MNAVVPMKAWRVSSDRPEKQTAHACAIPGDDTIAVSDNSSIDPQVLRWMPVAVPLAAVLLCAGIALIWVLA